ncbi:MAG: peptidyl-tRNA hydrolase [Archaeoglobales archaeon]|jgi:PTH2 family peptidyl-tRNA hydrolase|nr:peptidyl-tRNA hydrolase Pth2 [Archaeoglobi archaeon]NHW24199.1 peptidyl-tRNA hydrolase [Archaeoglobales archaeon]TDA27237.1 MAG: peptidyl-tRNA hydrolase [Archaeoglobi archaeon]TDA27265.1 MAG: peptidyl-tRNA hydrolase [Archaeoglobi archaeon]TDA29578.1 MAG: peptidyl-tRNA hydrolase [Archaeoglobi archaeon]
MGIKQVIVVRDDLELSRGKLAVQVAHASILGFLKSDKEKRERWLCEGQKKIVLRVKNLEELFLIRDKAEREKIPTAIVEDAGLTEIPPGTITAVVLGPDEEKKIDKITGNLPLLR